MADMPKKERYFASYFDVVRRSPVLPTSASWIQRWQYIVLPPVPGSEYHVIFTRYQNGPKNRSIWKGYRYRDLEAFYRGNVEDVVKRDNTELHLPVVVELTLEELSEYAGNSMHFKTPWQVINRAKRRAGYVI